MEDIQAKKFQNALVAAKNSTIVALNKNQDSLYDIFFKVIAIPNVLVILAAAYPHVGTLIKNIFYLKFTYLITIYTYLMTLLFYVCSFLIGNAEFKARIEKFDNFSDKLEEIIYASTKLPIEFQTEMNALIKKTHQINKIVDCIKNIIPITYVINVVSFIVFIVILINNLI